MGVQPGVQPLNEGKAKRQAARRPHDAPVAHVALEPAADRETRRIAELSQELAATQAQLAAARAEQRNLLQSRAWRVAEALREAAELVGGIANRARHPSARYSVSPQRDVVCTGPNRYDATSADPQLALLPPGRRLPSGWIFLRIEVPEETPYLYAPQLFFDTGPGWSEANSIRLPAPVDGQIVAFCRLPRRVRALRLDVGDQPGAFTLGSVRIAPLWGWEAWAGHLGRAALNLPSWHPSHTLDHWHLRGPGVLGALKELWRGGADVVPPKNAVPGFVQQRQPRLALYANADNVARATETQARRPSEVAQTDVTPGVSVVILNLDKPELIIPLIESLRTQRTRLAARGLQLDILIGDTGSTDPAVLACYADNAEAVTVVKGLRYHFARCNNAVAFAHARGDALLFLNNDIIFPPGSDALFDMYQTLHDNAQTGVVGCGLYFADGTVQHLGIDFFREPENRGLCFHPQAHTSVSPASLARTWPVPAVTGACLMIKRQLFVDIGGMDTGYAAECQDIALCLAADRLGSTCQMVNAGPVIHLENATRPKGEEHWPDRQRFLRRWGAYIEARHL